MPRITGFSMRGADRVLEINRVGGEAVRFNVCHPRSGEGSVADVASQELAGLIEKVKAGGSVELGATVPNMMVQLAPSDFFSSQFRPGFLSVWVRPVELDSTRRGGEGWFINVPIGELDVVFQEITR
jgi:hypothetical protein